MAGLSVRETKAPRMMLPTLPAHLLAREIALKDSEVSGLWRPPKRMRELRFAIIGTGFWARYQLAAWGEVQGARCVALSNRTRSKAEALGREFGISAIYESAEEMFAREKLDFVDIITDVGTHRM